MKNLLLFCAVLLLIPVAWNAGELLSSRHDNSPEYIVTIPNRLEVKDANGEYSPHTGPYHAGEKLTYAVERISTRTVMAKTSRRIVQKIVSEKGIARVPIFTYPSVGNGTRIDANPPGKIVISHVTVDLPGKDVLPIGKGMILESAVEFPAHGERDATTYVAESEPFDVE